MKTYICHHAPLIDRKIILSAQLKKCGMEDAEWVERYPNVNDDYQEILVSVQRKYAYSLVDGIGRGDPYFLILEDDVDLPDNFNDILNQCMLEFEDRKGEMLSLGLAQENHYIETPGNAIHYKPNLMTRCCHAIIYSRDCALKIVSEKAFWTVDAPIDHKLNDLIYKLGLKHFWYEPGIGQAYYKLGSHLDKYRG